MAKVMIVYESKYGNTRYVADTIAGAIRESSDVEVLLNDVRNVDAESVRTFDVVLVGSPNHFGAATRRIRKFIDALGSLDSQRKPFAVFDTCFAGDCGKATRKMERQMVRTTSAVRIIADGLSVNVAGARGPVSEQELLKCKRFGQAIALLIKERVPQPV